MQADTGNKVYQTQGKDLLVYTVNKVGWYEYITEWRFQDDGTLTMDVGATGSLSPGDYDAGDGRGWPLGKGAKDYATSHSHNVFWRLNFGLDGSSKTKVEQYDSAVSPPARGSRGTHQQDHPHPDHQGARGRRQDLPLVAGGERHRQEQGRPRRARTNSSPGPTTKYPGRSFTRHDVYFTQYNKCEQFASNNLGNCGAGHGSPSTSGSTARRSPTPWSGSTWASTTSPGTRTSSPCPSTGRASPSPRATSPL